MNICLDILYPRINLLRTSFTAKILLLNMTECWESGHLTTNFMGNVDSHLRVT